MKIKIALNIAILFFTFTCAVNFTASFRPKKNDLPARAKIYNFLLKDQQINREMFERTQADETEHRLEIWKQYKEQKFKLDKSDLPEDFRNAWERRISSEIDWINFFYYFRQTNSPMILQTDAQIEIFEKKDSDYRRAFQEYESLLESYGIGYDKNGELVKK